MQFENSYPASGEMAGQNITWVIFDDGEGDIETVFEDNMNALCQLDPTLKSTRSDAEPDWFIINRKLTSDELRILTNNTVNKIHCRNRLPELNINSKYL